MRDLQPGDWPLHMHLAQHGPFRMLPQAMGAYRIHAGGIWSRSRRSPRYRATLHMLAAAREHFDPFAQPLLDRTIALHRLELAWNLVSEGDRAGAAAELAALLADADARRHVPRWQLLAVRLKLSFPRLMAALAALRRQLDWRHPIRPPEAAAGKKPS
jgi:hypothetical protein